MRPGFQQLMRRVQLFQAQEHLQTAKAFVSEEPLDPQAQEVIRQLVDQATAFSKGACLDLPLATSEDGCPTVLVERRQGAPCGEPTCIYRYIVAAVFPDLERAQHAAGRRVQHAGLPGRYFASLRFRDALAVDARALRFIDERLLRENNAVAIQHLRAFRDAGAGLIWIRGINAKRVAVLFIESIPDSIEVTDEAAYFFRRDEETWERQGLGGELEAEAAKRKHYFSAPHRPRRISHWSARRILSFLGWELFFAMIASIYSPLLFRVMGTEITIPIWGLLLITLPLGWISGRVLFRTIKPYKEFAEEFGSVFWELPKLMRKLEEDREFVRRSMTHLAEEAARRDEDDDDLEGAL